MTKGKKLSDFLDEKAKKKLAEAKPGASKDDSAITHVTVNNFHGNAVVGNENNITQNAVQAKHENIRTSFESNNHDAPSNIEAAVSKEDDSALKQGRKPIRPRVRYQRVRERHMTPKELAGFTSGRWDGIEDRPNTFDWSAWDWKNDYPTDDVVGIEKRIFNERRQKDIFSGGVDRRKVFRRSDDVDSHRLHIFMLSLFISILLIMATLSVLHEIGGFF